MENNTDEIFGTPSYEAGGSFTPKYERWRLSQKKLPSVTLRILPPMKSLRESQRWSVYFGTVFGWNGVGKDPSKPKYLPFLSVEEYDFNTKTVTFQSDIEALISAQNAAKTKRKNELIAAGIEDKTDALCADPEFKALFDWTQRYSINRAYYVLAVDENNKAGILQLNGKAYKALRTAIDTLVAEGENPLSADRGIFFTFTRHGNGFITPDSVVPARKTEEINGRRMQSYRTHAIDGTLARTLSSTLPDLVEFRESYRLPLEAMNELAATGGDPKAVNDIWDRYKPRQASQASTPPAETKAPTPTPAAAAKAPTPKAAAPAPTPAAEDVEDDEIKQMEAKLAAARAAKAAAATATKAPPKAAAPTPPAPMPEADLSDLDDIFGSVA